MSEQGRVAGVAAIGDSALGLCASPRRWNILSLAVARRCPPKLLPSRRGGSLVACLCLFPTLFHPRSPLPRPTGGDRYMYVFRSPSLGSAAFGLASRGSLFVLGAVCALSCARPDILGYPVACKDGAYPPSRLRRSRVCTSCSFRPSSFAGENGCAHSGPCVRCSPPTLIFMFPPSSRVASCVGGSGYPTPGLEALGGDRHVGSRAWSMELELLFNVSARARTPGWRAYGQRRPCGAERSLSRRRCAAVLVRSAQRCTGHVAVYAHRVTRVSLSRSAPAQ